MSLRYRLFLAVSGIFLFIACCSYFIENYVTRQGLQKAQEGMRKQILSFSEKRRVDLQDFLASILAENEEKINAILSNLSSFSPQVLRFGPTLGNSENGTWEEAADILLEYKWIDFLQNTNQGEVTAAIIPRQTNLEPVYRIDIDQDLSWVYLDDLKVHPVPYLGVRIPYTKVARAHSDAEISEKIPGAIPEPYLLFDVQKMMAASVSYTQPVFVSKDQSWPPIAVKWTEGYVIEVAPLLKAFQRAREMLLNKTIQPPQHATSEISKKIGEIADRYRDTLSPIPVEPLLSAGAHQAATKERLEEIALNYTQISMIWALVAIYDSGIFGKDLFHFPAPSAITLFNSNNEIGAGFEVSDVFSSEHLFDDSSYYRGSPPENPGSNLASSIAVITSSDSEHVYMGNTAQFTVKTPAEDRVGYLTLGVDINGILQKLVYVMHQTALLVHAGNPLSAYSEEGERIELLGSELPYSQMLSEKSGIISWNKENYFFIHLQPFPTVDLHIFFMNPESVQFSMLRELQKGSKQIVDSILLDIHIAGLIALVIAIFLLNYISRRITKPIIQLAQATKEVAEGHLDQIQLSLPPLKHQDEIAVLCHSFEEMVKGLIEKEKVKGVLNKVVSSEIAQEILKGNVHLGGEEKKVTVLFADIRDFTKMTQNMLPQQVIDLLNGCMTVISKVIDKNGGVIDKFVGDEAMALFGAPILRQDDAFKALLSAVEMIEALKSWNSERLAQGKFAIEMGIGIHTGLMLAGNMGAENRLNYTVIGSNVNLASRLCAAAKRMEILITKDTLDDPFVKDRIIYEALPPMTFKGIDKQVEIFRVQGVKR